MRHIVRVTQFHSPAPQKAIDPAGVIFLQIWAWVMGMILVGALGEKDYYYYR